MSKRVKLLVDEQYYIPHVSECQPILEKSSSTNNFNFVLTLSPFLQWNIPDFEGKTFGKSSLYRGKKIGYSLWLPVDDRMFAGKTLIG